MSLVLLGSTSGSVTLQEPAVAGSTVIDLPATSGTMAVLPTATSVLPQASGGTGTTTGYYGFKNRLINGSMVIDQRNAGASQTVTTAGAYTVDRFFVQPTGASVTTQRVAGPSGYQYALRLTGAASVTQCFVQQKIEQLNSNDLAGQTVTVSFTASSSTLTSLTCYVEYASAADNWTTFTTSTTQAITINSTATRYSFQATLSASATNGIRFIFGTGAFTSGTLDITGVQLEKGSTATSFDYRPYSAELALCQRYYVNVVSGGNSIATGFMWNVSELGSIVNAPVTMRASPSLVQVTGTAYYAFERAAGNQTFSSFTNITRWAGQQGYLYTASSGTTGHVGELRGNNAASYIAFSSEL